MSEHACWVCTSTETRRKVAEVLRRNPGVSLKAVAAYAGTSKGQAQAWRWYMRKRGCLGAQLPVSEVPLLIPDLPRVYPIGTLGLGLDVERRA